VTPALHARFLALHGEPARAEAEADAIAAEAAAAGAAVVVVSACLLGEAVRWDGADRRLPAAVDPLLADPAVRVLPLCPELLGGMGCPRPPVSFAAGDGVALLDGGGRVVDDRGRDASAALRAGGLRAADLARRAGARAALLQERSPSCGTHQVHGPAGLQPGQGVLGALLHRAGLALTAAG
jgi:uncharacterized protein YbbK (DUF523 family)